MILISKSKKYIYGLDLSMACSGVAVFDLETFQPILISHVKTDNKKTHGERLHTQREYFKKIKRKYPPEIVCIENSFTKFNKATQVLYRAHGVLNELFHEYTQVYYAPTTVKKTITGNGRAKKDFVQNKILKNYPNIRFTNNDESDAVGVAVTHLIKKYNMEWN